MKSSRLGIVFVICAPSGTGKSTLIRRLCGEFPEIGFSVSCTTRAPRAGEIDGRDYHFISREEFLSRREAGFFAEWAEVHGNFYGTPLRAALDMLEEGRDALFDIDVKGAAQLRESFRQGCHVFILPPSRAELLRRLTSRGTDAPEVVARRMANAAGEMREAGLFDHLIVNGELDAAYDALRAAYLAERSRPRYHPGLVEGLLAEWAEPAE